MLLQAEECLDKMCSKQNVLQFCGINSFVPESDLRSFIHSSERTGLTSFMSNV